MEPQTAFVPTAEQPMNGRSHLTLTVTTRAGEIVFRTPHEMDLWSLYGGLPLLKTAAELGKAAPSAQDLIESFRKGRESMALANELLIACALAPELTDKKGIPTADLIYIECLGATERLTIMRQLLDAAGFTGKEAARIRPTSPTASPEDSSTSSTPSGKGTGKGRAS